MSSSTSLLPALSSSRSESSRAPPRKRARTSSSSTTSSDDPSVLFGLIAPSTLASSTTPLHKSAGSSSNSSKARSSVARNQHWVFCYGTSKRGFPNSGLLSGATFIGEFRTVIPYPLVVGGAYFSPYLLDAPGKGSRVKGELYAVSESTLATLDRFENVGPNYARKVIKVASCSDRSFVATAFVYVKCNYSNDLLVQRYLSEYHGRRKHLTYTRNSRPASSMAIQARNEAGSSMYNGRYSGGRSGAGRSSSRR